jgi:hypothetical protein
LLSQVSLLVRVKLCKELLKKRKRHVEAVEALSAVHKALELLKCHLEEIIRGHIEAVLESRVLL